MSILKRLPFVSLVLLLLTYTTLGWVISKTYAPAPWFIWLLAVIAILVVLAGLTISWRRLTEYSFVLFKSNLKSFSITVLAAFLFFLMIAQFRVFLDTLVIIAAAVLGKIDFQTAGFTDGQAFCFLSIFSLTGLALGALIHKLI
ncbi:hypothetical protein SAMD00079811_53500 [Scytonema sp. HK-05]|uniref:hypothetical protein n=1 Tax=Scytonema sp. HK-05 TaxID=1137095 RepID=UPI000937D8DA|nr:hypothetical protein [Scytonema sp. HK-05]OKH55171.1 hypothetical protein NIES2130_27260 [Scytonema sp. HK-05]BAY47731.1 hypothetical protein SAMD00079811_53500 [Scytonema sp. HK-05]